MTQWPYMAVCFKDPGQAFPCFLRCHKGSHRALQSQPSGGVLQTFFGPHEDKADKVKCDLSLASVMVYSFRSCEVMYSKLYLRKD